MKTNIGNMDRIVRAVFGTALIGASLAGFIGMWGWIGIVPLATAVFSFCPLYAALGMDSCHGMPHHHLGA